MKLSLITLASVLCFSASYAEEVVQKIDPTTTAAPMNCGPNKAVDEYLKGLGARPFSAGLSNAGTVIELMTHEDGSWALVEIFPTGVACVLRSGADMGLSPDIFLYRRGPQV